ncbi:hypothetical protein PO81_26395, partial [Vibrio parahaemolyticus]
ELNPSWKQIFSKYLLEFEKSKIFSAHVDGELRSLENSVLLDDGSIIINNKKQTELQNYKIFKNILNFIMQIMRNFVTFI